MTSKAAEKASIEKISVEEKDARLSQVQLLIKVKDRVHLAQVIKRLRTIRGVTSIARRRET